jgi:hypothetical protein
LLVDQRNEPVDQLVRRRLHLAARSFALQIHREEKYTYISRIASRKKKHRF